jgi:hypothetical protein
MEYFKVLVLIVHISAAAVLFGVPLGLTRMVRGALAKGSETFKLAAQEAAFKGKLAGMSSMVTLMSGLGLIFLAGGFAIVPKNFHAALALMLGAFAVSITVMRPNIARLVEASLKEPIDESSARAAVAKLGMGTGILHALWIVILGLMFVRF